jgi:hypothetical protein
VEKSDPEGGRGRGRGRAVSGDPAATGDPAAGGGRSWLLVFLFLLAANLFFFSGRFHSVDEMALLTTTESMVKWGRTDINPLAWEQWFLRGPDQQGSFNDRGDLYAKKGPLVSWLAVPLYALAGAAKGKQPQVAFLLNDLVAAATGALLFSLALRLRFSRRTAFWAAILFGLGTSSAVYARTLFGEPLAGLGLTLVLWGIWRHHAGEIRWNYGPLLVGTGLAVALLTNPVYLLLAPIAGAVLLWASPKGRGIGGSFAAMVWPPAAALLGLAVWNTVHFLLPWTTGYHWAAGEGFHAPVWLSLPALLVSPARGLLWYVPAVLLSAAGLGPMLRTHRRLTLAMLALAAAHLFIFGAWWMWWSGWGWGPRFFAPLSPVFVLLALPALERAGQGRRWKIAVPVIFGLSVAVQILGSTVGFDEFEMDQTLHHLVQGHEGTFYPYGMSGLWGLAQDPHLGHLKLLLSGVTDLAWRPGGSTDAIMLLALLLWIGLGGWALYHEIWKRALRPRWRYGLAALSAVLLVVTLDRAGSHPLKAGYGLDPAAGSAALELISKQRGPTDGALLVRSVALSEMYQYTRFPRVYGMPYGDLPGAAWDSDLMHLVDNARARHNRLWLVVRSQTDRIAAQIDGRLKQEMRRSDWFRVEGYEIALYVR